LCAVETEKAIAAVEEKILECFSVEFISYTSQIEVLEASGERRRETKRGERKRRSKETFFSVFLSLLVWFTSLPFRL
jgi:hypothetical protein